MPDASSNPLIEPLQALLDQLIQTIRGLDVDVYAEAPVATSAGTIGAHVRHSIDHANAWLEGIERGRIAYDHRERGTDVEHDPDAAIRNLESMLDAISGLGEGDLDKPVTVVTSLTSDGEQIELPSTNARELAFVFSHTVHHNAMIAFLARAHGRDVPADFGVAPSTLAYRATQSCAR